MNEYEFLNWLSTTNYASMQLLSMVWMKVWATLIFVAATIGMTPLKGHHEDTFLQVNAILARKAVLLISCLLVLIPAIQLYLYDVAGSTPIGSSTPMFTAWVKSLFVKDWLWILAGLGVGTTLRILYFRYVEHSISSMLHKLRRTQVDDSLSDIREERATFVAKDFLPSKFYKDGEVFIGLDAQDQPIYVSYKVWIEVNFQVIGPTRYGKGVIIGVLADQLVRRGDAFIYVDPKKDTFAPALMYQAAQAMGRKFYYVCLHDDGPGQWAPFQGGTERDALARIHTAFQLEYTGDPGTDFYKSQEGADLLKAFKQTRNIDSLYAKLQNSEAARIKAELTAWKSIKALCPKPQSGFSMEQALLENAVVYVQGSLTDSVVKTATKIFIVEMIQESMRLRKQRTSHLTAVIDEVRFLVSKQLADALATVVGFDVNIVTAYQSIKDLEAPDDKSLNGQSILQSINVNSQLKAVYGGADYDTAEWIANLSGTLNKTVTKMQKTEIRKSGGEVWDDSRMLGIQEENYIPTNRVLALPPRVCVFIQPGKNATPCFTSFVPVEDTQALPAYLEHLDKKFTPPKPKDQPQAKNNVAQLTPADKSFIDHHNSQPDSISHAKSDKKPVDSQKQKASTSNTPDAKSAQQHPTKGKPQKSDLDNSAKVLKFEKSTSKLASQSNEEKGRKVLDMATEPAKNDNEPSSSSEHSNEISHAKSGQSTDATGTQKLSPIEDNFTVQLAEDFVKPNSILHAKPTPEPHPKAIEAPLKIAEPAMGDNAPDTVNQSESIDADTNQDDAEQRERNKISNRNRKLKQKQKKAESNAHPEIEEHPIQTPVQPPKHESKALKTDEEMMSSLDSEDD